MIVKTLGTAFFLGCAIAATLPAGPGIAEPWIPPDNRLEFTITRDGSKIGSQVVTFARDGERLVVDTKIRIAVRIAFVVVHRFERDSRSIWQEGHVHGYEANVNNNGKNSRVTVTPREEGLAIAGKGPPRVVPHTLLVSEFWNDDVLSQDSVINTTTGTVDRITVGPQEKISLEVGNRSIPAIRYRVTGKATRDVWYDERGGLLRIARTARDGSKIVTQRRL